MTFRSSGTPFLPTYPPFSYSTPFQFHRQSSPMQMTSRTTKRITLGWENGKAPGLENISREMLNHSSQLFAFATLSLWQAVGRIGFVPSLLRSGMLAPIYKVGSAFQPDNYRLIILLPVFRNIVTKALVRHLRQAYTFDPNQWGLWKVQTRKNQKVLQLSKFARTVSLRKSLTSKKGMIQSHGSSWNGCHRKACRYAYLLS